MLKKYCVVFFLLWVILTSPTPHCGFRLVRGYRALAPLSIQGWRRSFLTPYPWLPSSCPYGAAQGRYFEKNAFCQLPFAYSNEYGFSVNHFLFGLLPIVKTSSPPAMICS